MSDIAHTWQGFIQQEETQFTAAASEYTMTKMGGNINALKQSLNFQSSVFSTPGSYSWVCPDGVTKVILEGTGGGGGGGAGGLSSSFNYGGGGGGGCQKQIKFITVVPGTTYSVTIGAAGAGGPSGNVAGTSGGNTLFGSLATFLGATGGGSGTAGSNNGGGGRIFSGGGQGSSGANSESFNGGTSPGGNYGGGGGASSYGAGGNGSAAAGSSASSSSYGAGGGGGGYDYQAGGNGAGGYLAIYYQST